MEFKDRIELLMKSQHMTRQAFGQLTGISQPTLSNIFNGKTVPSIKVVSDIKSKIPSVSTDWLLFGIGNMFNDGLPDVDADSSRHEQPTLDFSTDSPAPLVAPSVARDINHVEDTPNNIVKTEVKYIDKPQRKITEIRIFYDDQTWETFLPQK